MPNRYYSVVIDALRMRRKELEWSEDLSTAERNDPDEHVATLQDDADLLERVREEAAHLQTHLGERIGKIKLYKANEEKACQTQVI